MVRMERAYIFADVLGGGPFGSLNFKESIC